MYDIKNVFMAKSVQDAIEALTGNENTVLIAGGTDVLVKLRESSYADSTLVSIHRLPELNGVWLSDDGAIVIGSGTSFADLETNLILKKHIPTLAMAAGTVGGPQIRRVATIGGNVCNGAVSADTAPMLLALDALLELEGPRRKRSVCIRSFYTGPGKTIRDHNEILTGIRINIESYQGFGGEYIKFGKRNAMEIATLGCAANVRLDASKGSIEELRLAFGVAAPTPIRCPQTEAAAAGKRPTKILLAELGQMALKEVNPRDSWRASRAFRLHLARELTERAVAGAIINAGGVIGA